MTKPDLFLNGITPFIISDDLKGYYYRGLKEWIKEPGYLLDTCRTAQDRFKVWLDYFKIKKYVTAGGADSILMQRLAEADNDHNIHGPFNTVQALMEDLNADD